MIKYYLPNKKVYQAIESLVTSSMKVLEVGPGHIPFSKAQEFCGWSHGLQPIQEGYTICNVSKDKLPYKDKEFDFVYCRHVLEDLYNPFLLVEEMSRVAHSGYLETPSPIAELCRGVDGANQPYRGYIHHRYIVWSHNNKLNFVAKYPVVEKLFIEEPVYLNMYLEEAHLWNTYFLWVDKIEYEHFEHEVQYNLLSSYEDLLKSAIVQSKNSSDTFYNKILKETSL